MPTKVKIASEILEVSRRNVRRAASAITSIAQRLDSLDLVKYLPTTGVTVLLPAIIIHLLDIKAPEEETRRASLRGFCQCMVVMGKMRDLYAAADYSTAFLEAAIRKAGIHIAPATVHSLGPSNSSPPSTKPSPVTSVEDLVDAGRRLDIQATANATMVTSQHLQRSTLTPPPDNNGTTNMHLLEKSSSTADNVTDDEVARRLESFLASTPPESDNDHEIQIPSMTIAQDPIPVVAATADSTPFNKYSTMELPPSALNNINHHKDDEMLFSSLPITHEFDDGDFDSLLNLDAVGETFTFDDGTFEPGMQMGDVDWLANGGVPAHEELIRS